MKSNQAHNYWMKKQELQNWLKRDFPSRDWEVPLLIFIIKCVFLASMVCQVSHPKRRTQIEGCLRTKY
jgi:hypothetical protein